MINVNKILFFKILSDSRTNFLQNISPSCDETGNSVVDSQHIHIAPKTLPYHYTRFCKYLTW